MNGNLGHTYNHNCTVSSNPNSKGEKGSPSHSASKQKDMQMHQNFQSKPEFSKLSSFSNEISFDEPYDPCLQSNKIDVKATVHSENSETGNDDDEISVMNKLLPSLPADETVISIANFEDAETTYMSEDLIPFETFIDMGQFWIEPSIGL